MDIKLTQQKEHIEQYIAAYNALDVEAMLRLLHEAVVFEHYTGETLAMRLEGIAAFEQQARQAAAYFTERRQTIETWQFENDRAIVTLDYHAVLAMDFPNGMKAGDALSLKGTSEFQFHDGKIIGITDRG